MAFNVGIFTFLIYRLLQVYQMQMEPSRKRVMLAIGILLLIAPVSLLSGFIRTSPAYMFIYPVAISLFLYLIKET